MGLARAPAACHQEDERQEHDRAADPNPPPVLPLAGGGGGRGLDLGAVLAEIQQVGLWHGGERGKPGGRGGRSDGERLRDLAYRRRERRRVRRGGVEGCLRRRVDGREGG